MVPCKHAAYLLEPVAPAAAGRGAGNARNAKGVGLMVPPGPAEANHQPGMAHDGGTKLIVRPPKPFSVIDIMPSTTRGAGILQPPLPLVPELPLLVLLVAVPLLLPELPPVPLVEDPPLELVPELLLAAGLRLLLPPASRSVGASGTS